MGNAGRGAVCTALVGMGFLTGCSADGDAEADAKTTVSASPATDGAAEVAGSGGRIGAAGSACELPVTFDVAAEWEAETVNAGAGDSGGSDDTGSADRELTQEAADLLLRQGPVTAACEIDAKPAGHIGFLRVWTGKPDAGDARATLEGFVTAEDGTSEAAYRKFTTGGLDGVEVTYLCTSELLDETKKERALAVGTPDGPVVLHLGGMDSQEHEAMLPAYELAKRTLHLS